MAMDEHTVQGYLDKLHLQYQFGQIMLPVHVFEFRKHCRGMCEIYIWNVIYSGIEVIQNVILRPESSSSSIVRPR